VRHLRQKVERDPSSPQLIRTVRGVGYAFGEDGSP
jgi:DNA-binding response OmpR family regulator